MRRVPDPDHADWVRRMRERARLDAEELLRPAPFEVYGLVRPSLQPVAMADTLRTNGEWAAISLAYGDWADPAGPFVLVTTAAVRRDARDLGARSELIRAIDRERNRIADHAGLDEDDPPEPPAYARLQLLVGDAVRTGLGCRHGSLWAARVRPAGLIVTVLSRGVPHDPMRLGAVTDLAPYWHGRGERLAQLSRQHRQFPSPVLQPAEGVAAFRSLIDGELAAQARLTAALCAGREPRRRAGEGARRHAQWQRAVREQARLSGIGDREADEAVTLVVNHVTHLQEQAPWFTTEPELRERAIDETLRHAVLGEDVPSLQAQRAWARYWGHRNGLPTAELDDDVLAHLAAGEPLVSAWLRAWQAWAERR